MDIRKPNPTEAAGILRKFLQELGIELKHATAMEALARMEGYNNRRTMAAHQKKLQEEPPALRFNAEDGGYTFVGSESRQRVWITIGNISVYAGPTDEGVVVDLFAHGAEDRESLASTYLHFDEAMHELCDSEGVEEEDVVAWYAKVGSTPWADLDFGKRCALVREYAKKGARNKELRYVHGEWEHIFPERRSADLVRFVFDRVSNELVAMQGRLPDGTWIPSGRASRDDLEDSLKNANYEVLDDPAEGDLQESDELPDWARPTN